MHPAKAGPAKNAGNAKKSIYMNVKISLIIVFSAFSVYSQQIDSTLPKAYRYNSQIILEEFFMNWEYDSRLSDEEEQRINTRINSDDTLKEVYKLANLFYKYSGREEKYYVIEDTLKYEICYADTILSCDRYSGKYQRSYVFFPFHLDREDSGILYLNSKYNSILQSFFSSNETDIYKLGDEYEAKRKIFESKIHFYCREISGFKPYRYGKEDIVVPDLWSVIINKELNRALLSYSTGHWSSETSEWEKIDGQWRFKIVRSQSTY